MSVLEHCWKNCCKNYRLGFKTFGHTIGTLVNSVLLFIVYFFGVGLTFLLARLLRKRFLDLKKQDTSYWKPLHLASQEREEYYRQF